MSQIARFPTNYGDPAAQPTFCEWMDERTPVGKRWVVMKVCSSRNRFGITPKTHWMLLPREFDALERQYSRETGITR